MIIELHNFGPIERFTFDTEKRMHFIFGENNVGKSYAITAVYLILKNIKNCFESIDHSSRNLLFEKLHQNIIDKIKQSNGEINITDELQFTSKDFLNQSLIPNIEKSFINSFTSISELKNKNSSETFKICIHISTVYTFEIKQKYDKLIVDKFFLNKKWSLIQDSSNRLVYNAILSSKLLFKEFINIGRSIRENSLELQMFIVSILFVNRSSSIYFLPASRSGIYNGLSAWSSILVQLTQFRNQNKDTKFEIPTITEPISDYFLNLTNIEKKAYSTPFSKFAKKIEDNIIKGKINFDKVNRKLYYEPTNLDLSLELSQASSMISEIAPIIAHLKFIFDDEENVKNGRNYIFIEEPEAHLHPKVQVALIQLFAEMAKEGLHVVMTSHSNYMFNKLSNMVLAKEIAPETISVGLMKLGEKGSYIDETAMHIDEDGIDDDNFSETAEALYTERLKLYEQNPT